MDIDKKENSYIPKKYDVRVRIFNDEPCFGKGVVWLLEGIEKYGSLSASYKAMGMAQSKAWKILNKAENDLGVKLVERTAGGKGGGSSSLTEDGKRLVEKYKEFDSKVSKAAEEAFADIFK